MQVENRIYRSKHRSTEAAKKARTDQRQERSDFELFQQEESSLHSSEL